MFIYISLFKKLLTTHITHCFVDRPEGQVM